MIMIMAKNAKVILYDMDRQYDDLIASKCDYALGAGRYKNEDVQKKDKQDTDRRSERCRQVSYVFCQRKRDSSMRVVS